MIGPIGDVSPDFAVAGRVERTVGGPPVRGWPLAGQLGLRET